MKRVLSLLLIAAVLSPGRASAQDDLRVTEAKRRMVEGKKLHAEGKFEAAYLKFVEACAVIHSDKCLLGLAITEHGAGKEVEAYNHFRALLEPTPKPAIAPSAVQDLSKAMAEAYARTGHIRVSAPEHAVVLIDGEEVGHAPLTNTVTVKAGPHVIEANNGGGVLKASVDAAAGQVQEVALTEPEPAITSVVATPVVVPPTSMDPPREIPTERRRSAIASPVVPIALGVAAIGLAVGGTVMHLKANSADTEAATLREQSNASGWSCAVPTATRSSCDRLTSLSSTSSTERGAEAGMYIGASLAALGAIAWVVWRREESISSTAIVPIFTPHVAGAALTSSF